MEQETGQAQLVSLDNPTKAISIISSTIGSQPEQNPAIAYINSLNSKKSRQTMVSFLNRVANIIGFDSLDDCPWASLRRHHVQAIKDQLIKRELAPSTINTYLAAIRGVALEAWQIKLIDTDTYQHIKLVKSVRGSRLSKGRALEGVESQALLNACSNDSSSKGRRDAAIFAVLLGCGLRRSELVSLNLEHISWTKGTLKVLGKGNKERLSYMPDGTITYLENWVNNVRGDSRGPLFTRIRRHDFFTINRLSDQAIYHILEVRRIETGLDNFSPHDLRRTFASALLDNGEDLITVRDAMGHESITTTQVYDKRGDERLRKASKGLTI